LKCFVPDLALGVLLPEPEGFEDKLGGIPWGLPRTSWPRCRQCGAHQVLLAQLAHHPERLDLGREGRVLFAFQCRESETCATWDGSSGANAVLVVESADLGTAPTPLPDSEMDVVTEARVLRWRERELEEGVNPADTALGGAPCWYQGSAEPPGKGWRFLVQLEFYWTFPGPVPSADALGCEVHRCARGKRVKESPKRRRPTAPFYVSVHDDGSWTCSTNVFADSLTYVFLRAGAKSPEGWLVSQAT
jgi:hypothetical protein